MRIPHAELETCLGNPQLWVSSARAATSHPYAMSYDRALRFAIFQYHRSSAEEARDYLAQMVQKHDFKNARRISEIENKLESYIRWSTSQNVRTSAIRTRIQLVDGFLELRGEIGRVDVIPSGYRAILLATAPVDWQKQLRMPLIQLAVSKMNLRPVEETQVGFQDLDGSNLDTISYANRDIYRARAKFRLLGTTVRRLSGQKR